MSIPYGMITGQGMDPRALNAGNLLYAYGNPVMGFPGFPAGYGPGQRVKSNEETTLSDKTTNSSTQLRLVKWGILKLMETVILYKNVLKLQSKLSERTLS